jgi:tripartite-type tricarboxylate transporter receptor subunit TctC
MLDRRRFLMTGALLPLSNFATPAASYPERPIRIVMPYAPGGVQDTIIRSLAVPMEERLGQRLVIENKPGAAGNIGTIKVMRAEPDGYSLVLGATNNFVINQHFMKMPADPMTALVPIARAADVPLAQLTNPNVPARTLPEFIAYVKSNPGKVNFGSPSIGTVNHLMIERIKQERDLDITHVPYRGGAPAATSLLANDIQLLGVGLSSYLGHVREGKLVVLAVGTEKRFSLVPEVGTLIEAGFPGFTASNWWGLAAPVATPQSIVETLRGAVAEAQRNKAVIDRFEELGILIPNEPRRGCRRLQTLRRWSHHEQDDEQVFSGSARPRGAIGSRPREGAFIAMGSGVLGRGQDWLHGAVAQ